MHDLIRYDYINEVAGLAGLLSLRFMGIDLNDVYIDDDVLGDVVKDHRTQYKIRTVRERYLDPQSLQNVDNRFPLGKDFKEWFAKNSAFVNQLDRLVEILNTTNDMTAFRGAYNKIWSCCRDDQSSLVSLCEIKPKEVVRQQRYSLALHRKSERPAPR
ncbi:MAG: hypothetical protein WC612_03325 [Bdellovibrionales bacterium]